MSDTIVHIGQDRGATPDCGYLCDLNDEDQKLIFTYEEEGDYERAASIKLEMQDRMSRCLGTVMCNGKLECGILHDHKKQ